MTYCVALLLDQGMVFIADTRTNAGLDDVSTFRKLNIIEKPGDRILALAAAGNLSMSQSVVSLIMEGIEDPETGRVDRLENAPTLFKAVQFVGRAVRQVRAEYRPGLAEADVRFNVSFLFGGQIGAEPMRLFMVYAAGNFIECGQDAPFLQIGEHKYGKPILDRAVTYDMDLYDALKIGLISIDSTMRSNLGVGLPVDLAVMRRDALATEVTHRIEAGEIYFNDLRERWSTALRAAHMAIPRPPYGPKR
ncbi:MAG: peptidase [Salinarimonadaceae bacterium]|nr:MAG: peptidase [Salinarimonadaceae bacterium]